MGRSDHNRYHTVKRSQPVAVSIPDAETYTGDALFEDEYCFFKIFCEDSSFVAGLSMYIRVNGQPVYGHNMQILEFIVPDSGGFCLVFAPLVGLKSLSLSIPDKSAGDVVNFVITGYERVEY